MQVCPAAIAEPAACVASLANRKSKSCPTTDSRSLDVERCTRLHQAVGSLRGRATVDTHIRFRLRFDRTRELHFAGWRSIGNGAHPPKSMGLPVHGVQIRR